MKLIGGLSFLFVLSFSLHAAHGGSPLVHHLTMDDLPLQPVHSLAHETGVEFAFTIDGMPSDDAQYGAFGPGTITFIEDPSIEGNAAGVLHIGFPEPVPFVQFGVARSVGTRGTFADVELFDTENVSRGVTNLHLLPMPTFGEARFTYNGGPIIRLTVSFSPLPELSRFALDNLMFGVIPEPFTGVLAALTAGMLGMMRRARIGSSSR